jgi:hypothetical protein
MEAVQIRIQGHKCNKLLMKNLKKKGCTFATQKDFGFLLIKKV